MESFSRKDGDKYEQFNVISHHVVQWLAQAIGQDPKIPDIKTERNELLVSRHIQFLPNRTMPDGSTIKRIKGTYIYREIKGPGSAETGFEKDLSAAISAIYHRRREDDKDA